MNIPRFSISRKITVSMFILIVTLFGAVSIMGLGLDLLPNLEYPVCSVITTYEGAASEDVERLITRPIEEMVATVKGVKKVWSTTREGISAVAVEFNWGVPLDFAAQDIREKISWLTDYLPEDASSPTVVKFNAADMPVLFFGVTGMKDTQLLREFLRDNVRNRLERLDGVASVLIFGGKKREINVLVRRDKLQAYKLSINDIIQRLRYENMNVTGGHLVQGHMEYVIRTIGEFKDLETILNTVVAMQDGAPLYLKDVARVVDTYKERRSVARTNRKDSVLLAIMKQSGANTVKVIRAVKKEVENIKKDIPPGIDFYPIFDQGRVIEKVVKRTTVNTIEGGILAVLMIFMFLQNWRPTLTITLAIPLSLIATCIGIKAMGYTFNIMTLGGMALGIGMLVDNAIVVIENIFRHAEEGEDHATAAERGTNEVGLAITASTLTTMAVFLPMALASGISGKLARPLGLTVCLSLLASLFVAITLVPMMASVIFKTKGGYITRGYGAESFERFKRAYERGLRWCLSHKKIVLAGAAAVFITTVTVGVKKVGMEFMPRQDTPMLMAMLRMPVGTSLEETDRVVRKLEDIMHKQPETLYSGTFIGLSEATKHDVAWGFGAADVNEAELMLKLVDKDKRVRSSDEIAELIRRQMPKLEDAVFEFIDMGQMMQGSSEQAPVVIKIRGPELDVLRRYCEKIARLIRPIDGIRDVRTSFKRGKPELQITIDREKASQLGLTLGQVANTVRAAMQGVVATKYRVHGSECDIRVRFAESDRDSIEDLRSIAVRSPLGVMVPLYQIAWIRRGSGPVEILREDQERKGEVRANIYGRDIGSVARDIERVIRENIRLPRGYFLTIGGTYKDMKESFSTLAKALIVAVILIYMVMAAQFESLLHPFVIMFTVPLAIIGVVLGLLVFGKTLSVPAFMGTIILMGVAVNNGIVMIDYINRLRRRGEDPFEAVVRGAATRLRPILITAFTTILGMLPMVFSRSEGAELRSPLGISVAFGLLASTMLTLFVVPTVYTIMSRIKPGKQTAAGEK